MYGWRGNTLLGPAPRGLGISAQAQLLVLNACCLNVSRRDSWHISVQGPSPSSSISSQLMPLKYVFCFWLSITCVCWVLMHALTTLSQGMEPACFRYSESGRPLCLCMSLLEFHKTPLPPVLVPVHSTKVLTAFNIPWDRCPTLHCPSLRWLLALYAHIKAALVVAMAQSW